MQGLGPRIYNAVMATSQSLFKSSLSPLSFLFMQFFARFTNYSSTMSNRTIKPKTEEPKTDQSPGNLIERHLSSSAKTTEESVFSDNDSETGFEELPAYQTRAATEIPSLSVNTSAKPLSNALCRLIRAQQKTEKQLEFMSQSASYGKTLGNDKEKKEIQAAQNEYLQTLLKEQSTCREEVRNKIGEQSIDPADQKHLLTALDQNQIRTILKHKPAQSEASDSDLGDLTWGISKKGQLDDSLTLPKKLAKYSQVLKERIEVKTWLFAQLGHTKVDPTEILAKQTSIEKLSTQLNRIKSIAKNLPGAENISLFQKEKPTTPARTPINPNQHLKPTSSTPISENDIQINLLDF